MIDLKCRKRSSIKHFSSDNFVAPVLFKSVLNYNVRKEIKETTLFYHRITFLKPDTSLEWKSELQIQL